MKYHHLYYEHKTFFCETSKVIPTTNYTQCIFNGQEEDNLLIVRMKTTTIILKQITLIHHLSQNSGLKLKANLTISVHLDFHYVKSIEIGCVVAAEMWIILHHDKPDKWVELITFIVLMELLGAGGIIPRMTWTKILKNEYKNIHKISAQLSTKCNYSEINIFKTYRASYVITQWHTKGQPLWTHDDYWLVLLLKVSLNTVPMIHRAGTDAGSPP